MRVRPDLTVIMVAPKCPGTEVREEYKRGFGAPARSSAVYARRVDGVSSRPSGCEQACRRSSRCTPRTIREATGSNSPRRTEHLGCTSAVPRLYFGFFSAILTPRLYLGRTSAVPRLYLGCTSAAPRLCLGCVSARRTQRRRAATAPACSSRLSSRRSSRT